MDQGNPRGIITQHEGTRVPGYCTGNIGCESTERLDSMNEVVVVSFRFNLIIVVDMGEVNKEPLVFGSI